MRRREWVLPGTFQIVRPFGGLRVIDNLVVAALYGHARERSRGVAEDRAREILGEVGLARDAARLAETLTLAGRKRLEVGRAYNQQAPAP